MIRNISPLILYWILFCCSAMGSLLESTDSAFYHHDKNGKELGRVDGSVVEATLNSLTNDNLRCEFVVKLNADITGGWVQLRMKNLQTLHAGVDYDEHGNVLLKYTASGQESIDKIIELFKPVFNKRVHPGHKFTASYTLETKNPRAGESLIVRLVVRNVGDSPFTLIVDSPSKGINEPIRDTRFEFVARNIDASLSRNPIPLNDTHVSKMSFSSSSPKTINPGETMETTVDLSHFFDFEAGQYYHVFAVFPMKIGKVSEKGSVRLETKWDDFACGSLLIHIPSP